MTIRDEVIPFAAVDPRRHDVVNQTIELLEKKAFKGIKLYPPLGYTPTTSAFGRCTPTPRSTAIR